MFFTHTKRWLIGLMGVLATGNLQAQVNITSGQTATALAQSLAGDGVIISNAVLTCPTNAYGVFQKVLSSLPIDSGIILTTGQAQSTPLTPGVNNPEPNFATVDNEAPGDADLDAIAGVGTNDACVLEFDFIPSGDTIRFHYIFASEEYNGPHGNYNCSINDVFGFFISGPGYSGLTNIALIPGTTIPVGVSTVNDGVGASPGNPCYTNTNGNGPYTQYYNSNSGDPTWVYTGYTDVFTALATVTPCSTYHLKLAIADAVDNVFDSGVFIEAGSLTSPSANIHSFFGAGLPYAVRNCYPGYFEFSRPYATTSPFKVKYQIGGTAVNGVDYVTIADSIVIPANQTTATLTITGLPAAGPTGPVSVKLYVYSNTCDISQAEIIDSAEVMIYDQLDIELLNNDTTICHQQSVQLYASGDSALTFLWTPSEGLNNPNIPEPLATPDTTTTYTVTATFPPSGCPPVSKTFTVFVEPNPVVDISPNDTSFCLNNPYPIQTDVNPKWFSQYTYTWTPSEHLDDPTIPQPDFYTREPGSYRYVLTVTTPVGCTGSDSVHILTRPAPQLVNVTEDFTIKYGEQFQLNAEGATYYTWTPTHLLDYPTEQNPTAKGLDTVTFQVIGTDQYGCRDTAYVRMNIDYEMNEWVPSAFTPNGDGRNDIFSVKNLRYQRLQEFRIFNRWGQEIFSTTDPNQGWDGTFKGQPQEIGVYHYLIRVTTPDGKQRVYKGDVSLLR